MSDEREPHWIEIVIFFGSIFAGLAGLHGLCIWGALILISDDITKAIKGLKK